MSKTENCDIKVLNIIKHIFFSGCRHLPTIKELKLSWESQKCLVDSTILHPLVQKYPMSRNYCKVFLKKIIKNLETHCDYVHDDWYSCYCSLMQSSSESENVFYKHYMTCADEESFVTIKESPNLIIHGTTGLRTWQAAMVLADWAICNKEKFQDKHIVELGSGLGMTGIVVSKQCGPASFCFSDCHPIVLKALEENILINYPEAERNQTNDLVSFCTEDGNCLSILNLDWNNVSEAKFAKVPDIVLGADIVYDSSIFDALCGVLRTIKQFNENAEIILVSTVRNEVTTQDFLKELYFNGFQVDLIKHEHSKHIYWDEEQDYIIMKIYYKK